MRVKCPFNSIKEKKTIELALVLLGHFMQLRLLAGNKNGTLKQGNKVGKMSKGQEVKGCKGSITQVYVCVLV